VSCCADMKLNGMNVMFGISPGPSGWHHSRGPLPRAAPDYRLAWAKSSQAVDLNKNAMPAPTRRHGFRTLSTDNYTRPLA
jgi:hypothetical protein